MKLVKRKERAHWLVRSSADRRAKDNDLLGHDKNHARLSVRLVKLALPLFLLQPVAVARRLQVRHLPQCIEPRPPMCVRKECWRSFQNPGMYSDTTVHVFSQTLLVHYRTERSSGEVRGMPSNGCATSAHDSRESDLDVQLHEFGRHLGNLLLADIVGLKRPLVLLARSLQLHALDPVLSCRLHVVQKMVSTRVPTRCQRPST